MSCNTPSSDDTNRGRSDVKIVDFVLIEGEQQPNPNAIEPPSAPKKKQKPSHAGELAEEEDDDDYGEE